MGGPFFCDVINVTSVVQNLQLAGFIEKVDSRQVLVLIQVLLFA